MYYGIHFVLCVDWLPVLYFCVTTCVKFFDRVAVSILQTVLIVILNIINFLKSYNCFG